ncbi:hypothetical protein GM3708_621 [Geminocystis sp. NIES-3708]|nr:hypothetical protein GM3708_621 [Geminocystis sp. NIES-3708]
MPFVNQENYFKKAQRFSIFLPVNLFSPFFFYGAGVLTNPLFII